MSIVDTILAEVKRIPPLSDAGTRLMGLIGKDTVAAGTIAEIVAQDASLAAQLLRVSNSAAYRRKENIESINLAISLLGNRTVLGVVMGYCMSSLYSKPLVGYEAPKGALWRNSVASAIAAQLLTAYVKEDISPELAYTAGLLHSLGKAVLSEYMKESVEDLVKRIDATSEKDFLLAEEEIVGTNHCVVGAALARHWHLPESLCQAIEFHHTPSKASEQYRTLVYIIHLADAISMIQGIDTGVDAMGYSLDPAYEKYIIFPDPTELDKILMKTEKEYSKLTESFNP